MLIGLSWPLAYTITRLTVVIVVVVTATGALGLANHWTLESSAEAPDTKCSHWLWNKAYQLS